MNVNAIQTDTQSILQSPVAREKLSANFQTALESAKQNFAPASDSSNPAKSTEHPKTSQMTDAEYLADYVRKTPEQRMRDAILKEMGLTEEDLAAMPPEKRTAIEHTIEEKIKEILQRQHGNKQIQGQQAFVAVQSLSTQGNMHASARLT